MLDGIASDIVRYRFSEGTSTAWFGSFDGLATTGPFGSPLLRPDDQSSVSRSACPLRRRRAVRAGSGGAHGLGPKSTWPKRYQQINGFERMRSESRMRIIMFLLCLQRGAGQAIPRAWKTNGRTGGSRTPRSRGRAYWDQYIEAFTFAVRSELQPRFSL